MTTTGPGLFYWFGQPRKCLRSHSTNSLDIGRGMATGRSGCFPTFPGTEGNDPIRTGRDSLVLLEAVQQGSLRW